MQKLWIENRYELAIPILFCLGRHRLVNSEYNLFTAQFKNNIEPIVQTEDHKEFIEHPRLTIVKDPDEADQHWFMKANYTTFLWWYMVNVGLKDNAWQKEYDSYTDLDDRHKMLYDDHMQTQLETLDVYSNTSTLIPFYGWNMQALKIGFNLPADMECDMAADAWLSWLERYTPQAVKHTKHIPAN